MLFGEPEGLSHHTLTANSINQHCVIALMDHLGHDKIALVGHDRSPGGNRFAKARAGYWFFKFLTHFYRDWSYNPEMLSPVKVDVYLRACQQPGTVRGSRATTPKTSPRTSPTSTPSSGYRCCRCGALSSTRSARPMTCSSCGRPSPRMCEAWSSPSAATCVMKNDQMLSTTNWRDFSLIGRDERNGCQVQGLAAGSGSHRQ